MTPKVSGSPEPIEGRCGAKLRGSDAYCQATLAEGARRCRRHGGATTQAQAKAAERVAEKKFSRRMRVMGILDEGEDYDDVDPAQALLRTVAQTAREVEFWEWMVRDLDPDDVIWGRTEHEEGVGPLGAIDKTTEKAEVNVAVRSLIDARGRLVKWSSEALKAGIAERRVRIAEDTAAQIVGLLHRFVAALGLTPEQAERIPQILPPLLRELEGAA